MNCCIFFLFFAFTTVAFGNAVQNDGIIATNPTDSKRILSKCCKEALKNDTVNCDALVDGDINDVGFNATEMWRQSKATGEQIAAYLFTCVFTNASEDHSQCCREANATEQCLPLCMGDNGDILEPNSPLNRLGNSIFGANDRLKHWAKLLLGRNDQVKRIAAFFDERQCLRFIVPALTGQQCHPIPVQQSADGVQKRFLPLLPIVGTTFITLFGGSVIVSTSSLITGVITVAATIGAGIGAAVCHFFC